MSVRRVDGVLDRCSFFFYARALFVVVFCFLLPTPPRQTGITKLDDANHAGTARSQVRLMLDTWAVPDVFFLVGMLFTSSDF